MSESPPLRVSVIVPVYNQAEYLAKCLDALAEQTLQRSSYEVIVIDNGSTEPPEELVAKYGFARFGQESRPGSYAARNRGLEMARGEILAFTDADCLPHPQWLEAAVAALDGAVPTDVVAGRIDVMAEDPARPSITELYDIAIRFDQRLRVKASNGVVTANMVTRRAVFDTIGPFDQTLMSGADAEWSALAAEHGYQVRYVETAVVSHPARKSLKTVLTQTRRIAQGRFDIHAAKNRWGFATTLRQTARKLLPRTQTWTYARRRLASRGYGWWAWVRVIAMMQVIHYASAINVARRMLGAKPERQ